MNRIQNQLHNKKSYVGYLTAGDGGASYTIDCALAMIEGGVDILEIGFPFSDPIADGPIIQAAHSRALAQRTNAGTLLTIIKAIRRESLVPIILFTYFNPLLQQGIEYLSALSLAGVDGVLIVDLPTPMSMQVQDPYYTALIEANLLPILLASPSSSNQRLQDINKYARGFVYYTAQKGTTGKRSSLAEDFSAQMARVKTHITCPVVAGFGIADKESARQVLHYADGFVVGSALVEKIAQSVSYQDLVAFVQSLDPRE